MSWIRFSPRLSLSDNRHYYKGASVGPKHLYISKQAYDCLGHPKQLIVSVNLKRQAIRLTPSEKEGWKVTVYPSGPAVIACNLLKAGLPKGRYMLKKSIFYFTE